jgi:FixJ family two-component response regulator
MTNAPSAEKVFVVDDDPSIRESLRWLLESVELGVETYESAEDFLDGYDTSTHGCLLLDVRMPGMSGLSLQKELQSRGIGMPIIFITGHGDVPLAVRACKAGALDFIEKPFSDQRLLDLVREALEKERAVAAVRAEVTAFRERLASLTGREREIMDLVADGRTNREMAAALGVSPRTVEVHRARLTDKLGVDSVATLVRMLIAAGAHKHSPS